MKNLYMYVERRPTSAESCISKKHKKFEAFRSVNMFMDNNNFENTLTNSLKADR